MHHLGLLKKIKYLKRFDMQNISATSGGISRGYDPGTLD
jgi:hypothetical protein